MPDPEVLLAAPPFHGLNRVAGAGMLSPSESPDCTDCRRVDRTGEKLGARLGRQRVTTHTYNLLGLGMLNVPFGRYKVTADSNGDWIASAVTWAGVTPPTPTVPVTLAALTSNVVTLTVALHGFRVGQAITVSLSDTNYNGTYTIATVPTINTFTYALTHANIGSASVTGTVTSNYSSAMSATATARFMQFKDRLYGTDGKSRGQAFDGIRWRNWGILGGVDLPQFTPSVTLGGGSAADVTNAEAAASVATLTTAAAHGFTVGQYVTVLISDTQFNGTFVITVVPSTTTFKYALAVTQSTEVVFGTATVPSSAGALVVSSALSAGVVTIVSAAHGFSAGGGNTVYFTGPFAGKYLDGVTTGPITYISSTSFSFTVAGITAGSITAAPYTTYTYPPGIAPTVFGVGTNTGISGTYYYAVAPANSKRTNAYGRMIEGNPSIVSAVASPSNQSVTVGNIPSTHADEQVDRWNIYRTTNGGYDTGLVPQQQDFFYLTYVPIGTTSKVDTEPDSSGWYQGNNDNSNRLRWYQNMPPTAKWMAEYAGRIFLAGFDPITGTCTVANGSATVNTISVTLPNGTKGCYIRFAGEQERYEIKTWIAGSPPTLTLDRVYEGTQTSATSFSIHRGDEIWFSEENDGDAFGKDGEQRRNMRRLPGGREVTGIAPFQQSMIVFTHTEIWVIYGKGPNPFDIKLITDAACIDAGCVSHDTICRVGNELHFLSLDGPASISSSGTSISVNLYGVPLNVDWLDGLTAVELERACAGTDGRAVWYSVVASGQVMNSKTFRFERDDGSWWEELGCNPKRFIRQDGTDGQLSVLFYLQGKAIVRPAYGSLDLVSAALGAASPTATTNLKMTATGFPTTNGGLVECYVRLYSGGTPTNQLGTLVATRRIISNTSTEITWSSDATLPGSGTVDVAYDEYEIGNIPWYWQTRTQETPGHAALAEELDVTFEEAA